MYGHRLAASSLSTDVPIFLGSADEFAQGERRIDRTVFYKHGDSGLLDTHYLSSCLVERMAIDALYLLQLFFPSGGILLVQQVWLKRSMGLERDINVMLSRLAPLVFL